MHPSYPVAILYCINQLHQSLLIYQLILNNHICIWKQSSILSIFFIYQSITVVDDMCCYFMSSTYTVIRQITELNPIDNIASHYVCIYIQTYNRYSHQYALQCHDIHLFLVICHNTVLVTLWLFNIAMVQMALIEIDGLPGFTVLKTGDFPWQTVNVITRW